MASFTRRSVTASTLALVAAGCGKTSTSSAPARTSPEIGTFGIDLTARDLSVKPGDDFNKYCNGAWLKTAQIPADRTSWGAFDMLAVKSENDVKAIVEEVAQHGGAAGSNEQKIADFYKSFNDTAAITAKGMAPAQADLAAIAAATSISDIVRLASRPDLPVTFPIGMFIDLDARNPDAYAVVVTQSGLGLPDREYYLRSDAQFAQLRQQYQAHIARTLTLAGQSDANHKAQAILAFETQVAHQHWPIENTRDVVATYNKKTKAELIAISPSFPWDAGIQSAGLGAASSFIVSELSAMAPLARVTMAAPIDTLKAYLTFHYIANNSSVLPTPIDDEHFAFFGKILNGQPQQRDRWKRALRALDRALGEAVGPLYVARHFPASSKAAAQALVENMRSAFGARIDAITWMSADTKARAHEKLRTFRPKIGYPDKWRDYAPYEVRAGDAFGNNTRSAVYEWNRQVARLNQKTDRDEWGMTPPTINAYYNPTWNEIVFPAAILQPPFFDPNADAAVNYGGIGGVIGHEMGHGFDDQGARQDAQGILRDWWGPQDVARFKVLGDRLAAQYSAFSPLPGLHVNGRLTLGENIGDNGGLQVAHEAYHISLNGATPPTLEGTTGEQRFFLSWGQVWREAQREEATRNQILSDPHSPAQYRINGVVHNLDAWYDAFNVQPGEALYLTLAQRVQIW
jgi:putative endopeptidase